MIIDTAVRAVCTLNPFGISVEPISSVRDLVTVFSAIVGACAASMGVKTYIHSSRTSRLSHMHKLFGDYLKMRLDLTKTTSQIDSKPGLYGTGACEAMGLSHPVFLSIKLYTLEEMWLWLRREYPSQAGRLLFPVPVFNRERIISYRGWLNTIEAHVMYEPAETMACLEARSDAYTQDFVEFCRQTNAKPASVAAPARG